MDNFPISAEVDSIIEIVRGAGAGGMDIRKLSSSLGKDAKETEKWVHMLEEQGVVRVEHHFTRVHVYWTGKGAQTSSINEREIEQKQAAPVLPVKVQLKTPVKITAEQSPASSGIGKEIDEESGLTLEQVEELLAHAQKLKELSADADEEFTLEMPQEEETEPAIADYEKENSKATVETATADAAVDEKQAEKSTGKPGEKTESVDNVHNFADVEEAEKEIEAESMDEFSRAHESENVRELAQMEKEIMQKLSGLERALDEQIANQPDENAPANVAKARHGAKAPRIVDVGVARFSGKLGEHVEAVNKIASEIERLNAQKQKIAREMYAPLEKKLESEMEVIATKLLQKEKLLMDLRARAAQIPLAAGELGEKHEKMVEIERQMKGIVDESAVMLDEARTQVSEAMEEVAGKTEEVRRGINSQYVRFEELKGTAKQIEQTRAQVEGMLAQAHAQLQAEQMRVAQLDENAAKLAQAGAQMKDSMARIWREIGKQQNALGNMQEQLHKLAEVDRWAAENELEYKRNMVNISEFVKNNEIEYIGLREEIEANFVRRYLRELRGITESYEYELGEASRMERGVDERIVDAKRRMEEMIQEGKRMAYLYELQLKEDAKEAYDEQKLKREKMFRALTVSGGKRTQVEQMIGEIIGNVQSGSAGAEREIERMHAAREGIERMKAQAAQPIRVVSVQRTKVKSAKKASVKKKVSKKATKGKKRK
ncbi:Uncharacterised protein [Candidatus Anstonella stagnisolia]|nr:Uncharacterised protein [Candidatus Anstonella stagnisolia]